MSTQLKKGIKKGIKKGSADKTIEIANNLKKSGVDINIIVQSTGLSIDEIKKL